MAKKKTKPNFVPRPAESPRVLKKRAEKKMLSIENLANNIRSLRMKITKDIAGDDEKDRLTALAISVMDRTAERVGNDESASNGHVGVTGFEKDHLSFDGDTVKLSYVGKSGVSHEKSFTNDKIADALKQAIKNSPGKLAFCTSDGFEIKADRINRYLDEFGVTAKDLRGYSANKWIVEKLQKIETIEPSQIKRQRQFNAIAKAVAEKVGHGFVTLKKHYLLPGLESLFVEKEKIMDLKSFMNKNNKEGILEKGGVVKGATVKKLVVKKPVKKFEKGGVVEKIPGGLASGKSLRDIEIKHGMRKGTLNIPLYHGTKVEMEHTSDKAIAREIALDHLSEDPAYYKKLKAMEAKEKKPKGRPKKNTEGSKFKEGGIAKPHADWKPFDADESIGKHLLLNDWLPIFYGMGLFERKPNESEVKVSTDPDFMPVGFTKMSLYIQTPYNEMYSGQLRDEENGIFLRRFKNWAREKGIDGKVELYAWGNQKYSGGIVCSMVVPKAWINSFEWEKYNANPATYKFEEGGEVPYGIKEGDLVVEYRKDPKFATGYFEGKVKGRVILLNGAMAKISFEPFGTEEWHPINELKKITATKFEQGGSIPSNHLIYYNQKVVDMGYAGSPKEQISNGFDPNYEAYEIHHGNYRNSRVSKIFEEGGLVTFAQGGLLDELNLPESFIVNPIRETQIKVALTNKPVAGAFLKGPAGSGKTYMAKVLAKAEGAIMNFMPMFPGIREDDLIVKLLPSESTISGITMTDGIILTAIKQLMKDDGRIVYIVFDEWDKSRPSADSFLLTFLQDGMINYYGQSYQLNAEQISRLRVFLTMNDEREISEPLLRRLPMIEFGFIPAEDIYKTLAKIHPGHPYLSASITLYQRTIIGKLPKPATLQELDQLLSAITILGDKADWNNLVFMLVTKSVEQHELLIKAEDKEIEKMPFIPQLNPEKYSEILPEDGLAINLPQLPPAVRNISIDPGISERLLKDDEITGVLVKNKESYDFASLIASKPGKTASEIPQTAIVKDKEILLTKPFIFNAPSEIWKLKGEIIIDWYATLPMLKLLQKKDNFKIVKFTDKEIIIKTNYCEGRFVPTKVKDTWKGQLFYKLDEKAENEFNNLFLYDCTQRDSTPMQKKAIRMLSDLGMLNFKFESGWGEYDLSTNGENKKATLVTKFKTEEDFWTQTRL